MTAEQVEWCMQFDWYKEHKEIGNNIAPVYKVRVSDGMLKWFTDFYELLEWANK